MSRQRQFVAAAAAVGMLSTFLPWVTIPIFGSINGSKGDGWITFALFLVPLLISILGDRTYPVSGKKILFLVLPALLSAVIGIWKIIDFNKQMGSLRGEDAFSQFMGSGVSIGYGLYLLVIAGIALTVVAIRFADE